MNKIYYAKFNSDRNPLFQTSTHIYKSNERIVVAKKALSKLSQAHIRTFFENAAKLQACNPAAQIPLPEMLDAATVQYDYIAGGSFESHLKDAYQRGDRIAFAGLLNDYRSLLMSFGTTAVHPPSHEGFSDVFGEWHENVAVECLRISNIDLTFDNIIVGHDGSFHIIDYEWVFQFPVPVDFIIYRALSHFFNRQTSPSPSISLAWSLEQQEILLQKQAAFKQMEERFLKYVFRSRPELYVTNPFAKNRYSKDAILVRDRDLSRKSLSARLRRYLKKLARPVQRLASGLQFSS